MIKKILAFMSKIDKKINIDKVVTGIMIALIVGFPTIKLFSYTLYFNHIIDDIFEVNPVNLLWISLPILAIIYFICLITKKYKFTYIDYIMLVLSIFAILATIFAFNRDIAINGEIYRYEGLKSILAYYFIFLNVKNLKNEKCKKVLIDVFLYTAVFQVVYGLFQVYTNFAFVKHFPKVHMAMALCGNPNFFGSYIVMPLMISTINYLNSKQRKDLILTSIFYIGLCIANSTGPFLSFIIAFIFLLVIFHKKFKLKEMLILPILFVLLFVGIDTSVKYVQRTYMDTAIESSYNIKDEIRDTIIENKDMDRIANGRLVVWKRSLPLLGKYWLYGAGLDNFAKVFPQIPESNAIFDKAHNVYIQMGVTNGLIVLILYCTICFIAFLRGLKFKNMFYIGLYMAFVVYSIQAFGNINVIDVTPMFYMILALLYTNKEKIIKSKTVKKSK